MSQLGELVASYRSAAKTLRIIEHESHGTTYNAQRARLQQILDDTLRQVRGYDSPYAEMLTVWLTEEHRLLSELNRPFRTPPGVPPYQAREQYESWVKTQDRQLEIVRDDITRALHH